VGIEIKQYEFWAEFAGAIFGGGKKNKTIQSGSTPNTAELMSVGLKRK